MPSAPRQYKPAWGRSAPKQAARDYDERRGSARERGYGRAWEQTRAYHLARNPLCRMCSDAGHTTVATLVDHIRPVLSADDPGFHDPENLQSLCVACHAAKTAQDKAAGLTRRAGR